jgi:hypothetical protein
MIYLPRANPARCLLPAAVPRGDRRVDVCVGCYGPSSICCSLHPLLAVATELAASM